MFIIAVVYLVVVVLLPLLICFTLCSHRRYGVVSMCIGTGMGAAGVFEAEK